MSAIITIFGIPISAYMICLAGRAINKWYNEQQDKIRAKKEVNKNNKIIIKRIFFSETPVNSIDNSIKELMVSTKAMLELKVGTSEEFSVKSTTQNHYNYLNSDVGKYAIEVQGIKRKDLSVLSYLLNISIIAPSGRVIAHKSLRKGSLDQTIASLNISEYDKILFLRHSFGRLLIEGKVIE